MAIPLTPGQIEDKIKLIRQGLYWEALDLPQESSTREVVLRIASLRQSANNDEDFINLLNIVKRDFQSGNYSAVRLQVWEELFPKLNEAVASSVLGIDEEDISRETVWEKCISKNLSRSNGEVIARVRAALTDRFKAAGVNLANKAQEQAPPDNLTKQNVALAIKSLKKSIFCLRLAETYASNRQDIQHNLGVATEIELDYEQKARIRGYPIPTWPEPSVLVTPPPKKTQPKPKPKPKPVPTPTPTPVPKPTTPQKPRPKSKRVAVFVGVVIGSIVLFVLLSALLGTTPNSNTNTPGKAVDNTALTWTTGGNANWFSQTITYYYDSDAARSGDVTDNQATWLRATVTGPGTLTFYWRVSSESTHDFLGFYIDGVEQTSISGFVDWQQKTYSVTSGTHTLEWRYTKDGSGTSISDCGWLDKVEFTSTATPTPTISLGEAVDNIALTWTTGGNANWFSQTTTYYYDGDAARSGAVTDNQATWLRATVTGPGTLTFYWKVSSESDYDFLGFSIDGAEQAIISGSVDWQQETYSITSGTHTLGWRYTKDTSGGRGSDCGWLDKVEFTSTPTPTPTISLGEAVDNPTLTWTTGGNSEWFGQTTYGYYDGDAARSGDVTGNQNTWLRATVTGPGTLTFHWMVSSQSDYDYLRFYIDGVEQTSISGIGNWEQKTYSITSGTHILFWRYNKDGSVDSGHDCGWLDKVEFTLPVTSTASLGEAVDNPTLTWTTGGNAEWFGQATHYYYDGNAARSGAVTDDQATWLRATVTGPGTLTFYWMVSSQSDYAYDWLTFYIDGVEQTGISGSVDWQQKSYSINFGTHNLEWRYTKDSSESSGSDCGWLDKVEFTSAAPPIISLGEAVDNVALTWTTGGNAEWFSQTTTYYYDGDATRSGDVTDNQATWLRATVTGPGTLTFYWKVSSESDYDFLRFSIDGVEQTSISGSIDWQQKIYSITSGTHTMEWRYTKDYSESSGSDCCWVDKVEFTSTSTPTSPSSLILEDDFSNPSSGWFIGSDNEAEMAYEDGEYSVLLKKSNYYVNNWNGDIQINFAVEVDVRDISRVTGSCAGIMFRHTSAQEEGDSHYLFYIRNSDGAYVIWKVLSDEWTALADWTKSSYIKTGTATNRLKVVCQGSQIEVYANGQKLTTITDFSLASGYVGVVVETAEQPNAHYHFDNFKLYELTNESDTSDDEPAHSLTEEPDLIIQDITWSPTNPSSGNDVTFTVTVKNQGGGDASSSHVYYFVDEVQKDYDYISSIAAGVTSTQTFIWSAEPGSHFIKAIADYNNAFPESDESNNEREILVHVTGVGTLQVITGLDGGSIYVDGEYGGSTTWSSFGSTVSGLPEGTYELKVTKDGYKDWTKDVSIATSQTTTAYVYLESGTGTASTRSETISATSAFGTLQVITGLDGGSIYVDGEYGGSTTWSSFGSTVSGLPEGTYELKVTKPGYKDWTKDVSIATSQTTTAYVYLEPGTGTASTRSETISATSAFGTLQVITGLDGGSIYVDGEYGGSTTWSSFGSTVSGLPEGTYELKVTKDGYKDWTKDVSIATSQTTTVYVYLEPGTGTASTRSETISATSAFGTLQVITGLDGGSIYVDGEYGGSTTWSSFGSTVSGLPEGTYELKVTKDGYQDWITEINILASQTTTVEATLVQLP